MQAGSGPSTDLMDIALDRFDISTRARNCLQQQKITVIKQLTELTATDILQLPFAGAKTLEEVRLLLGSIGLKLAHDWAPFGRVDPKILEQISRPAELKQVGSTSMSLAEMAPDLKRKLIIRLDSLSLSARAEHVLSGAGLLYLGEMIQLAFKDIVGFKNSGIKTAEELSDVANQYGFELGTSVPDWSRDLAKDLEKEFYEDIAIEAKKQTDSVLTLAGAAPTCLEEELQRITRILEKERNSELLIKLWGWNGEDPRTLDSVGKEFGLTRERVRQIEERALERLKRHKIDPEYLKSAIELLRKEGIIAGSQLARRLYKARVARGEFSILSVKLAAEILGIKWPFSIFSVGSKNILIRANDGEKFAKVLPIVRRRVSEAGCLNIFSLASEMKIEESSIDALRAFLEFFPQIEWLDQSKEWLFLRDAARNRLLNLCAKVLGVCPRIRLSELRRAVAKSNRLPIAPSQKVLSAFVERIGLGRVEDGIVVADASVVTALNPDSTEAKMLQVLETYGPVMAGEEFAEKCIAGGINATTFYIYRIISPVICSLGKNVYSKVGADVMPGVVEEILLQRRRAPRVSDYGWTPNGRLWFGTELSRLVITIGSIRLRSFVSELVQGEWNVKLPDGADCGTVVCKDSLIWSFRKAFALLGVEPDDFTVIEFDMGIRTATVRVGGPELFEAIQNPQALSNLEVDDD